MNAVVRDLEKRLLQAADDPGRLAALIELADSHADAFENLEGLRAARDALQLARRRGDAVSIGRALSAATLCHYQRGDYVAAVATGLDAVEAYADGDLAGRASALQSIALALFAVESVELAESTVRHAIEDAVACGSTHHEAGARSVLAVILAQQEDFRAARREFRQACAIYRRDGDDVHVKKSAANVGHTYLRQGNATQRSGAHVEARFQWGQALRIYRVALGAASRGTEADDAIILGSIAECQLLLGDAAAAHASASSALALGIESPMILAPCHLWESHVLQALDDLKGAQRACERAVAAAQQIPDGDMLVACLRALSKIADRLGRFETASDLERRAREAASERSAALAHLRVQLGPMLERYTAAVRPRLIDSHA
jgi:tetratricopeptide (TPR) repeat protein